MNFRRKRTHQISVQFFADERADFHEAHEDEEAAEENRKTWKVSWIVNFQ